jgi:hypothetical protein
VANDELLSILRQGTAARNAWCESPINFEQDLSRSDFGFDLSGANLVDTNLSGAHLNLANLIQADLSRAILYRADLRGANLSGAQLVNADLGWTILSEADLSGADLTGAQLAHASLNGANLSGANLSRASFQETIFGNVDLSDTIGLATGWHLGPSTIDFRTLLQSKNLPISFLRGCGLPDDLIDYLPSLEGDARQFCSCFISYSTKDQLFADTLHADLQN